MQVDPIKATLKAPGTQRWKLKFFKLLSSFAFNFNLRRYITDMPFLFEIHGDVDLDLVLQAGAYTRPLFGST